MLRKAMGGLVALVIGVGCEAPVRRAPGGAFSSAPGTPTGPVTEGRIGAAGGTLRSADGRVTLEVPPGALTEDVTLSLQPISNTAPLGVPGAAVRLGPSGQRFSAPVVLTVQLTDEQLRGSAVESLWVLTQTADGRWRARPRRVLDAERKTVSVRLTGFSDWAIGRFADLRLEPAAGVVEPLGSVSLKVTGFLLGSEVEDDELAPIIGLSETEDILWPLTPQRPEEDELAPVKFEDWVRRYSAGAWSLSGEGSLVPNGLSAVYVAPPQVPAMNPVTVSLELETSGRMKLLLVTPIRIEDQGLWVEFEGQRFSASQATFQLLTQGSDATPFINIGADEGGVNGWSFSMALERPRAATFTIKRCGPNEVDNHSMRFSPRRGFVYDQTYWERSNASGVCVTEAGACGQRGLTVRVEAFDGVDGAIVRGSFEGTVYEDENTNPRLGQPCQTSRPFAIKGGFLGRLQVRP